MEPGHAHHAPASQAVAWLAEQWHTLLVVPQILNEFWAAATKPVTPESNGLGFSVGRTYQYVKSILQDYIFIPDDPEIFEEWLKLVSEHGITGTAVHDARLAAAMHVHSIAHILTFNGPDFARFPGIAVVDPLTVTPLPAP